MSFLWILGNAFQNILALIKLRNIHFMFLTSIIFIFFKIVYFQCQLFKVHLDYQNKFNLELLIVRSTYLTRCPL